MEIGTNECIDIRFWDRKLLGYLDGLPLGRWVETNVGSNEWFTGGTAYGNI